MNPQRVMDGLSPKQQYRILYSLRRNRSRDFDYSWKLWHAFRAEFPRMCDAVERSFTQRHTRFAGCAFNLGLHHELWVYQLAQVPGALPPASMDQWL